MGVRCGGVVGVLLGCCWWVRVGPWKVGLKGPEGVEGAKGRGPEGEGRGGVGAQGWGPEGWGPEPRKGGARRVGGPNGGGPKISRFFSLSHRKFHSFFSLWGVFSLNFGGVFEAPGP